MRKRTRRNKVDKDGYEYNFDGIDLRDYKRVEPPPGFPTPEEVAKMLKTAKITIMLDDRTILFFKKRAKKNGVSYQKMIREVLRGYTQSQQSRRRAA